MSDHTPVAELHPEAPARTDAEAVFLFALRSATIMDGYTAQTRRALGLNAHERLAVAGLWANSPMTMTELGAWIPLSRAAVTTLVDRLEAAGFVERGSDPLDRRRTVVSASLENLSRLRPVLEPWIRDLVAVVEELGDREWATIANFLVRVNELNARHAQQLTSLSDEEIQDLAAEATLNGSTT